MTFIKAKSIFYDLQEPTADDLNFISDAIDEQTSHKLADLLTNGILGKNQFGIQASYSNNSFIIEVGSGIAYINGRRIEIPINHLKDWDVNNPIKNPAESTGNRLIINDNGTSRIRLFLTYLNEYDPNYFDIDPSTYTRRFTKIVSGYAIGYAKYTGTNYPQQPEQVNNEWVNIIESDNNKNWIVGKNWIILGDIYKIGNNVFVDRTFVPIVYLKKEIQTVTDLDIHQQYFHSDGITPLTKTTFNYYLYNITEFPGNLTVGSGIERNVNIQLNPENHTGNIIVRFYVKNELLTPQNSNFTVYLYENNIELAYGTKNITVQSGITPIQIECSFTLNVPRNITKIKIEWNNPNLTCTATSSGGNIIVNLCVLLNTKINTYEEFLVETYFKELESGVKDIIRIYYPENVQIYAKGKRISQFSYKGIIIEPNNNYIFIEPDPLDFIAGSNIYYLTLDTTGNFNFELNPSESVFKIALFDVKINTNPSLCILNLLKDFRKLIDSDKKYSFRKFPIEVAPLNDSNEFPIISISPSIENFTNNLKQPFNIIASTDNQGEFLTVEKDQNSFLTLRSNGFIGIKNKFPSTDFHLVGNSIINGKLSIGTNDLSETLVVGGNIGIKQGIDSFIGTLDNYGLLFKTNNINRLFITNDGKIGINTINPQYDLDILNNTNSSRTILRLSNESTNPAVETSIITEVNNAKGIIQVTDTPAGSWMFIGTTSNHALYLQTNNSSRLIITQNGNVGINNFTPQYNLDVKGTLNVNNILRVEDTSPTTKIATIYLNAFTQGIIRTISGPSIGSRMQLGTTSNHPLDIITNNTSRITITNDGKIGINNNIPQYDLDILNNTNSSSTIIQLKSNHLYPTTSILLDTNHVKGIITAYSNPDGIRMRIGTTSNHPLDIITNNTSRITITNDGKIGINTNNPQYNLDINGQAYINELFIGDLRFKNDWVIYEEGDELRLRSPKGKIYKLILEEV